MQSDIMLGLYVLLSFLIVVNNGYPEVPEEILMNTLFQKYNKNARPATRLEPKVTVDHGMDLVRIEELKSQKLKADAWITLRWSDPRLVWIPEAYAGLTSISVPASMLWKPDVALYNGIGDIEKIDSSRRIVVNSNGMILWLFPVQLESVCDETMKSNTDQFMCRWKFGSWTYHGLQLNITHTSGQLGMSNYFPNPELDVVDVSSIRNVITYPCCPEPYPDVTYQVLLKRGGRGRSFRPIK